MQIIKYMCITRTRYNTGVNIHASTLRKNCWPIILPRLISNIWHELQLLHHFELKYFEQEDCWWKKPLSRWFIPLFTMFYTFQVVQDFFHQRYLHIKNKKHHLQGGQGQVAKASPEISWKIPGCLCLSQAPVFSSSSINSFSFVSPILFPCPLSQSCHT